jgi:dihydroxy-acid dehydratase
VVFAVLGAGLAGKIAIVTDGQLSGLANVGITVGEVAPEAAAGGPIGLVENGDIVSIDVGRRVADLEVPESVLAERRARLRNWESEPEHGWLGIYRRLVLPLRQGAVLRK